MGYFHVYLFNENLLPLERRLKGNMDLKLTRAIVPYFKDNLGIKNWLTRHNVNDFSFTLE